MNRRLNTSAISIIDIVRYHLASLEFNLSQIDINSLSEHVTDDLQSRMESICKVYNQQLDCESKPEKSLKRLDEEQETPKKSAHFEEEAEESAELATSTRKRGRPPKLTRSEKGVAKTQEAYEKQQQGRRLGGKRSTETRKAKKLAKTKSLYSDQTKNHLVHARWFSFVNLF